MGWYCHPDTMAIAGAMAAARQKLGKNADHDTLEFKKAYRDAYAHDAQSSGFDNGLAEYLQELDDEIQFFEQGGTREGYKTFLEEKKHVSRQRYFISCMNDPKREPKARWQSLKDLCPNPDDVVAIQEAYDLIEAIDKDVTWSVAEPQWWLDMSNYQRVLGKRLQATRSPIVIGWNKGGVGTTTLCELLAKEGIHVDEHVAKSPYKKGYKVRLIPVSSGYELTTLLTVPAHLKELRQFDPECRIFLVLTNYAAQTEASLWELAEAAGIPILTQLPKREWFLDKTQTMPKQVRTDIANFVKPIVALMDELGVNTNA
ncbi:MAG: hypothetical protein GY833_23065 [Aestuariibacter sp.]|nr:hypothetical protein [Aestuariibacter sp.]